MIKLTTENLRTWANILDTCEKEYLEKKVYFKSQLRDKIKLAYVEPGNILEEYEKEKLYDFFLFVRTAPSEWVCDELGLTVVTS